MSCNLICEYAQHYMGFNGEGVRCDLTNEFEPNCEKCKANPNYKKGEQNGET